MASAGSGSNAVPAVPAEEWTEREQALLARLTPLPGPPPDPTNAVADDPRAAHYGRWLFFDARLSGSGDVSCATCHDPAHQFADPRSLAVGAERGERHAPTLVEAAHQRWLGWGGRADSLWMQALGPLENPVEMAGDRTAIGALIRTDAELRRAHEAVFETVPDDDTAVLVQVGKALAAYERLLVREGRFDRYALRSWTCPAPTRRPSTSRSARAPVPRGGALHAVPPRSRVQRPRVPQQRRPAAPGRPP